MLNARMAWGGAIATLLALLSFGACAADGDLRINRISPSGDNVPTGQEVVFQFDRPMVPLGNMARAAADIPIQITPALACEWRWLDVSELACRLPGQARFRPATKYRIEVWRNFKALDGTQLAAPITQSFTTVLPQVAWSGFRQWRSPVMPVYLVRFNLPVTAQSAAASLYFDGGQLGTVAAQAEPYKQQRSGPLWLPVPDAPGAVFLIDNPQPQQVLDAEKRLGKARRQWLITPARSLAAASSYSLNMQAGLQTPLGPLAGPAQDLNEELQTYGPFRFAGISCSQGSSHFYVVPDKPASQACEPGSVSLLFTAPVTRATLAASQWQPAALPAARMAAFWKNYSDWDLRLPNYATDANSPDSYSMDLKLAAMSDYSVSIPAGVKDQFGRSLKQPSTVHFRTGHRVPFFNGPPQQAVLEAGQPTIVPLRFTNLDRIRFSYNRLFANDLGGGQRVWGVNLSWQAIKQRKLRLVDRYWPGSDADSDTAQPTAKTHDLPLMLLRQDSIVTLPLGLRAVLDNRSGVAWGRVDWSPQPGVSQPTHLDFMGQVTPFEVFAKLGHFNSLVWVNNLQTGQPVAGARVQMYSAPKDRLDQLTPVSLPSSSTLTDTDAQGMATLPATTQLPQDWFRQWRSDSRQYFVAVTQGEDMALLPLNDDYGRSIGSTTGYAIYGDNEAANEHMRTWAVTQQGIYRPGSEVKFAVFARNVSNTTLVPPPPLTYTLTVKDSGDNVVLQNKQLKLSDFGDAEASLRVPATAPTGWYTILLSWPRAGGGTGSQQAGRFLVTDFVPASFQVNAQLNGKQFGPGAQVSGHVDAKLHAGGPYADAKVKFTTSISAQSFAPDSGVAVNFDFDANPETAPASISVSETLGQLNHVGEASSQFSLPEDGKIHYGQLNFETSVESARGTWVANRGSAVYAARDRFIGLRMQQWLLESGQASTLDYLVVGLDGMPRAYSPIALQLQHQVTISARVKDAAGEFTIEQKHSWMTEDTCRARSSAAPGHCKLTPKHAGTYRILATVTDTHHREQSTTLRTWATGAGEVTWKQSEGVTLVPDKSEYHVGDTAHVLVQNPYPGAHALVTVERYGMLWKKSLPLQGSAPVLDIPITPAMFPGAYLSVTIFSPRVSQPGPPDLGRPEVALGYSKLKITGKGSSLKVEVNPDADEHKPRQTVQVNVQVRTQAGKLPEKTRLVAVVVDQAVVDLLADGAKYYDPRSSFYAPPDNPDMANFSLAKQLLTRLQPKDGKGDSPGGGGGQGPQMRSLFKYATYWNAGLQTDAEGHAHFAFKLPDNLTRWRILVIAMTPGAAMGLGDASVRVNLPIQLQPALPNQVHVGDAFGAGFDVTNRTVNALDIATQVSASGPIAGGKAQSDGKIKLDSFAHGIRWLNMTAAQPGSIKISSQATSGKLGDAMLSHIPVRRAAAPIVAAQYGSTTGDAARVPIQVPANALPGSAKLEAVLAPTLLGNLDGAFISLRDDPLQFWETRLSRGVLASDYLRLKPVLGDAVKWPDAKLQVSAMLNHAANFQAPNGGMAYWIPRNDFVSPYLSVYTALAFNWLQQAGHTPPASVQTKLRAYLNGTILAASPKPGSNAAIAAPILKAGALAALAPTGTLPKGAVAAMLPQLPQLDLFGQALLLQAALGVQDQESAKTIAASILSHAEESAGAISFNENFPGVYLDILATPLRSNCAVLDALVNYKTQAKDDHLVGNTPEKLMRWITAQRRNAGGWPNSQENVFCTTAITHYADAFETPVKGLSAQMQAAGKSTDSAQFDSRRSPAKSLSMAAPSSGSTQDVALTRSGQGRLYYNLRLSYAVPPLSVPAADAGFTVSREYSVQRGSDWQRVGPDTQLQRGDTVRVDLLVDAPTERHHVALTDPLPGAFEAVNRQLATAAQSTPASSDDLTATLMFDYGPWPNAAITVGGFYHRETAFDAVRFFADDLPAGHYHLVYAAQVISPGHFIAPAPQIKEIYQPDVFGLGNPQRIRVAPPNP